MMTENGPPSQAQPQVIYIMQAPKGETLKDSYASRAATVLGVIHILCGISALLADILGIVFTEVIPISTGIWASVFFCISGGLAIGGARSGNKCLIVATMVMSIISAVSAGILIIMSGVLMGAHVNFRCEYYDRGCGAYIPLAIQVVAGLVMLIVGITSSALTCKATCCGKEVSQGRVHYTSDQTHIQMPNLPTALEEPPTYHSVAGEGSKYQKF